MSRTGARPFYISPNSIKSYVGKLQLHGTIFLIAFQEYFCTLCRRAPGNWWLAHPLIHFCLHLVHPFPILLVLSICLLHHLFREVFFP